MRKLCTALVLLISIIFVCGCGDTQNSMSDQLRLDITHIDEEDDTKSAHISYPVFGGIDNKQALTTINSSVENYVTSEYNEFMTALSDDSQDVLTGETGENGYGEDGYYDETDGEYDETDEYGEYDEYSEAEDGYGDSVNSDDPDNQESQDNQNNQNNSKFTLNMDFKITYNKNDYLCIVQYYDKNMGADRQFDGMHSFLFSLKNATYITLDEIFDFDAGFKEYITEQIKNSLENSGIITYDNSVAAVSVSKSSRYYIDNNNLYIYYDAMELSPDKTTTPTFTFPLKDVKKYVTHDFEDMF